VIGASLILISAVWGVIAWWVFHRVLNYAAMRTIVRRIYARLLEIRLYSEEPALVWRAQGALIADNLRFLMVMAPPVVILALPFALLYGPLDSIYGYGPIPLGHSAVVTTQFVSGATYQLAAPAGITVETPPVRDFTDHQVSWRIRAIAPVVGTLSVTTPGGGESRSVAAGQRTLMRYSPRQSNPWIEIDYPRADVTIAGWSLPWLAWFFAVSSLAVALVMFSKRPQSRPSRRPIPKS
jgi:hypothetical protein